MSLLVDNRERHIIEELVRRGVPHQVQTLDVGDFHIVSDAGVLGIWERKTYADLASSLSDKRYLEQKHRIIASSAPYKGYILEGQCPKGTYHGLHPGAIDSIRIGLLCRDDIKVLSSDGLAHTVTILEKLMKKLPEYVSANPRDNSEQYRNALVDSSVSGVKKDNLTPELCYLSQLVQIPQISYASATSIQARYPNMAALVTAISSDRQQAMGSISNLKVSDRRLGVSVANKVCDYMVPPKTKVVVGLKTTECLV
jgi:ERCC4-type nuclease